MNVLNESILTMPYRFCERIMHLAYLNLLWILFSLLALGIFGIFPATATVFALIRQEKVNGITPTFTLFFIYFKRCFWKVNLMGWILAIVGYVIYVDFKLITYVEGNMKMFFYFSLLVVAIICLFVSFYVFPVYVHYNIKIKKAYFISLMLIFTYPIQSIFIGVVSLLHLYIIANFPGLIPFFGLSVWAFCVSHISHSAFSKVGA